MNQANRTRQRRRRALAVISVFAVVLSVNCYIQGLQFQQYVTVDGKENPSVCSRSKTQQRELCALARDTHSILKDANISHMLLEGSVWGALRYSKPLPWDYDFDMALFSDDMAHIDNRVLGELFAAKGISLVYRGRWSALYKLSRGTARGDLAVYRPSSIQPGNMVRSALERYLFYFNYMWYLQFPTRLAERPLPTAMFCGMNMSVPREGMEIQKYFYPNDWWRVAKPSGCQ